MNSRMISRCGFTLALALAFLPGGRAVADTKELGILLVIDTNAGQRGGDHNAHRFYAEANLGRWRHLVDTLYNSGPLFKDRLWMAVLKDQDATPAKIREFYKRLPHNPNRALLFYYSGHGAVDQQKGQFFATSGGDIRRTEVQQLMKDRGAPAVFILSDCCSSYVPMGQETSDDGPQDGRMQQPNWQAFYNLFYQHQGVAEITAAQAGEVAFSSLCTTGLCDTLYMPNHLIRLDGKNGPVGWNDYYQRVRQRTSNVFQAAKNSTPPGSFMRQVRDQVPALTTSGLAFRSAGSSSTGGTIGRFGPAIQPPPRRNNVDPEERNDRIEITSDP